MALYCLKNCMSLIHISQIFSHKMISHLHMLFLGFFCEPPLSIDLLRSFPFSYFEIDTVHMEECVKHMNSLKNNCPMSRTASAHATRAQVKGIDPKTCLSGPPSSPPCPLHLRPWLTWP